MLGILRRAFSFADWTQHHPTEPPPGDMLDASFDALTARISELEVLISSVLRSDGDLKNETVSFDTFKPSVLARFDQKLEKTAENLSKRVLDLALSAEEDKERAVLAENTASQAAARVQIAGNHVLEAQNQALARLFSLNERLDEAETLLQRSIDVRTDSDDDAALAEAWAWSSRLWAEHMPDTLPDNALKMLDITGDHWSSRWWAHQARLIGDEIRDTMLNPQRAGMLTLWYRATANQTVFPLNTPALDGRTFTLDPASPEQLDVSVNGIRLMPKPVASTDGDWTVDVASSTITLLRPLRSGDMVSIDVLMPVEKLSPGVVLSWSLVPLTGMNGVTNAFPLVAKDGTKIVNVLKTEELVVSQDGVVQEPIQSYTAIGATITFTTAPAADSSIFIVWHSSDGEGLGIMGPIGPAGPPGPQGPQGPPGSGSGSGGSTAWADITGKPATFPPTLPIASSGVTGLDTAQSAQDTAIAGKAATVHTHAQADITGLVAAQGAQDTAIGTKLDASAYTAADVLTKIKTVDGAGSGLDADLLDGQSSAAFAAAAHVHAYSSLTGIPSTFAPSAHSHPTSEVTGLDTALADRVKGVVRLTVASSAPGSPATNDVWIDTT